MTRATGSNVSGPSAAFWDDLYARAGSRSGGRPSAALVRFAEGLPAGRALDLGCARGDDAVWLASRGWSVVAVDISPTVLRYAVANAEAASVADRIDFQQHDLSVSLPTGEFDLVSALFLESPIEFGRTDVLRRATQVVAPRGRLIVVEHASKAPWSWGDPDEQFRSAEALQSSLGLDGWQIVFSGTPERLASGPGGQSATVRDNIVIAERPS